MQITGIDFIAVPVQDMARAKAFYTDVLGLKPTDAFDGPFVEFELGADTLALFDPTAMGKPFAPQELGALALRVADVAAARETLKAHGVEFMTDVFDSGVCKGAFFKDSEGNALSLHHRYAAADVKKSRPS